MDTLQIIRDQLKGIATAMLEHSPNIVAALLLLTATWLAAKIARRVASKLLSGGTNKRSLTLAIRKLLVLAVWVGGLALTAVVLFPSIKPSSLIAGLGLGSVAIGFAFKDIFENFFAGMLILIRQPFQIGDFIEVEGIDGKIEDITIRDTVVRQTDGQPVIIPNSVLFKNPVTVRTDRDKRRVRIMCGVGYGEDVDKARSVIQDAVDSVETVMSDEGVQVFAAEFGASSIDFEITWWTGSEPVDVRRSRDEVVAVIKKKLDEAGIEIPFPYRTLTFSEPLPLQQQSERNAA
ncbi:MAG: mechanosensitive ion channel family protein [Gammaproteobacteria bacterium]|nr:mechanosensitive ion channel family protein [Gammaproteobacteria bacterium]